MIRVLPVGDKWAWSMIGADGRTLAYDGELHDSNFAAFEAAMNYRKAFWALACGIDHRMGACI